MAIIFDHEKLKAYQASIEFITWLHQLLKSIPKANAVYNQIDRSSTSIALYIAEGNGKYSKKDRCRFFDIARGSPLESAAALDILSAKDLVDQNDTGTGKMMLKEIVSMLIGLIKSLSENRIGENIFHYGDEGRIIEKREQEQEQE
jgi:four helix bundle protein